MQFVTECQSGLFTMTELAEQYAITRKTGYKWLARYDAEGVVGLLERSRRPHTSPQAVDADLVDAGCPATPPSALGREETVGRAGASTAPRRVAEPSDRVCAAQTAGLGAAASVAESSAAPGTHHGRRSRP